MTFSANTRASPISVDVNSDDGNVVGGNLLLNCLSTIFVSLECRNWATCALGENTFFSSYEILTVDIEAGVCYPQSARYELEPNDATQYCLRN